MPTNANHAAYVWASSTAGVVIDPVFVFTSGTNLPAVAHSASGGLPTFGTSTGQITAASGQVTVATNNDKTGYTASTVGDKTGYTVSTVSDKTGYSLSVTPPTAAAIATAVWTDTTAGDFTTLTSPGKIIFAQLGGAFTTTSSSVFSTASLVNAGSPPSAATIAAAVWTEALPGAYTAGQAGYAVGTYLDAAVSTSGATVAAIETRIFDTALVESGVTFRQAMKYIGAATVGTLVEPVDRSSTAIAAMGNAGTPRLASTNSNDGATLTRTVSPIP